MLDADVVTHPQIITDILNSYAIRGQQSLYCGLINELPPSANLQYAKGMMFQKGGGKRFGIRLTAEAKGFRDRLILTNPGLRYLKPKGLFSLVTVFYFPWVTADRKVRVKDDDNLVKPLRDAIKIAMGVDDSMMFHTLSFKANSNRIGIRFWIIDLGTKVEYHE